MYAVLLSFRSQMWLLGQRACGSPLVPKFSGKAIIAHTTLYQHDELSLLLSCVPVRGEWSEADFSDVEGNGSQQSGSLSRDTQVSDSYSEPCLFISLQFLYFSLCCCCIFNQTWAQRSGTIQLFASWDCFSAVETTLVHFDLWRQPLLCSTEPTGPGAFL